MKNIFKERIEVCEHNYFYDGLNLNKRLCRLLVFLLVSVAKTNVAITPFLKILHLEKNSIALIFLFVFSTQLRCSDAFSNG